VGHGRSLSFIQGVITPVAYLVYTGGYNPCRVYNDGADESRLGMVIGDSLLHTDRPSIPVVGVSYDDGVALLLAGESKVSTSYD
jgi:hypothetical protein